MNEIKKIAIFHYTLMKNNPSGLCMMNLVNSISTKYQIYIFSNICDISGENIVHVRIPLLRRPVFVMFILFHLIAPIYYFLYTFFYNINFSLRIISENNLFLGDVSYVHFCHKEFLEKHWSEIEHFGVRKYSNYLNHKIRAFFEPFIYRKLENIIVPSEGLKRELVKHYPFTFNKIKVISNPVDIHYFKPIKNELLNTQSNEDLCTGVFVALGNFERKGLPLLLNAFRLISDKKIVLLVIGGKKDLINLYKKKYRDLQDRVSFLGFQSDIRKYLWVSDFFIFPTSYEVFPLVALEAAASGLPLITTRVNGIEEFVINNENGLFIERDAEDIKEKLLKYYNMPRRKKEELRINVLDTIKRYDIINYNNKIEKFIAGLLND